MRRALGGYLLSAPLALLVGVLLVLPVCTFFVYSFLTPRTFEVSLPLTTRNYQIAFTDPVYWQLMINSVRVGLSTAGISTILGYILAYYISIQGGRTRITLLALVVISILGGYLVRIYAWRIILGTEGVMNSVLKALRLTDQPLEFLLFSRAAVVIALVNIFAPFTTLTIFAALENIGRDIVEAARDLGAPPLRTFREIVFPLTGRAVFTSFLFVFLLAAADYITPQLIGGATGAMIGVVIYDQFIRLGNWSLGAALSFYIVIVFGIVLLGVWMLMKVLRMLPRGE